MVEKVCVYVLGSRYLGSLMNFIDKHLFRWKLQAELYSDLQRGGGNKQLERTCLEEERTAIWFIF